MKTIHTEAGQVGGVNRKVKRGVAQLTQHNAGKMLDRGKYFRSNTTLIEEKYSSAREQQR